MKDKKNIKVRDLKPSKDAKGGGHGHKAQGFGGPGVRRQGTGHHREQGKGHHHQER